MTQDEIATMKQAVSEALLLTQASTSHEPPWWVKAAWFALVALVSAAFTLGGLWSSITNWREKVDAGLSANVSAHAELQRKFDEQLKTNADKEERNARRIRALERKADLPEGQ